VLNLPLPWIKKPGDRRTKKRLHHHTIAAASPIITNYKSNGGKSEISSAGYGRSSGGYEENYGGDAAVVFRSNGRDVKKRWLDKVGATAKVNRLAVLFNPCLGCLDLGFNYGAESPLGCSGFGDNRRPHPEENKEEGNGQNDRHQNYSVGKRDPQCFHESVIYT
jgi:hypothetical protein